MSTICLFPTTLLAYSVITDNDYLVALTKAYNNYLAEKWLKHSPASRQLPSCPSPKLRSPLRRCDAVSPSSASPALFIAAVGFGLLGSKQYDPFWAEAEKLGTAVAVHGGHATAESQRYTPSSSSATPSAFPVSNMMQMMHMTYEGVYEKFPDLKVG